MKYFILVVPIFGLLTAAFPPEMMGMFADIEARQVPSTDAARKLSRDRTNCGPNPCTVFNAQEQLVSTSGQHAYASPKAGEIRGPCPGLNAAANHGYLSRSGVTMIPETIAGLSAAFGMSPELSAFLAAYAVIFVGNPLLGTWSIGGPPPSSVLTGGLLGGAQGISYSHNVYEGDASIGRKDAYLNNGDAYSLDIKRFTEVYALGLKNDRYTLDMFAQDFLKKSQQSIATNPYYFAAPFSGTLVAPVAYNFLINLMSNHSASQPSGYLDGHNFKQFFGVSGDYPNFKWLKGQERIPVNWYRRPSTNQYGIANGFLDIATNFAAYPDSVKLGGNTKGVSTYVGVNLSDLTGGAYHADDLLNLKTGKAACFYAQLAQVLVPDAALPLVGELAAILRLVNKWIKPITGSFDCPFVGEYDQTLFIQFPGYKYRPKGQATNYME
ncbi:hypothetical protein LTR37_001689 [Vermiconidia calcicola]|uniref:Uncharacterized protein n=1 Tax=Vermiconidia calcicola TaxID=1690605 RepID=A0ACC3NVY4_9PEZI|nr:hypothetical protein LTR37_001689 [Vermiconidia calcicola]